MLQVISKRWAIPATGTGWRIDLAVFLLAMLLGCTAAPQSTPVSNPTLSTLNPQSARPVTIRQLIAESDKFSDQPISLTGKIVLECPEGCWFFLDDGTGRIYVDLKPAGLTIPQKVGSRITLLGKTKGAGGNLQVLGEEVKFLDADQ
jgi:hypothetical protein